MSTDPDFAAFLASADRMLVNPLASAAFLFAAADALNELAAEMAIAGHVTAAAELAARAMSATDAATLRVRP